MRRTKNLHAVASLLMHQSLTTTRRYLQGVVNEESLAAIGQVTGDLGPLPGVSAQKTVAGRRTTRRTGRAAQKIA